MQRDLPAPPSLLLRLRPLLYLLLSLSVIPALFLAYERFSFEQSYNTVGLVMDYVALKGQAEENGLTPEQLLKQYQPLGVNGVAIYEQSLSNLVRRDKIVYRSGAEWRNERISLGQSTKGIESDRFYARSLLPGTVEGFRASYQYPWREVSIDGNAWTAFTLDVRGLSAGPDLELIAQFEQLGYFIAYRPYNALTASDPGANFPKVPYIIYASDEVTGFGDLQKLAKTIKRTQNTLTGFVEAADQKGMDELARVNPVVRVFSLRPEWQATLEPEEAASKFVLAARERNHRLLYLRPFQRIDDTKTFLTKLAEGLDKAKLQLGKPTALEFAPTEWLRQLSIAGPILGVLLLATTYPFWWLSLLVVLGVVAVSILGAGFGYDGLALMAGIVFPALGFALHRKNGGDWLRATAITMLGALLLAGLGTSRNELLALDPFRGVAATLVLPPLLLLAAMLPRQDLRTTIKNLWNTPFTLGNVALLGVGALAVFLVIARRGNTPSVGISDTEARVRAALQDELIRPRTKEVILHPLALLGLSRGWPEWFSNILLLASVIGQGSIIDTFAHFHTPILISLLRTVNGLAVSLVLGIVMVVVVQLARRFWEEA
jgi:hypothetical protein